MKHRYMSKKRRERIRKRRVCGLIIALLLGVYFVINTSADLPIEEAPYKEVYVSLGDTLWSIAEEHADQDTNLRKYVKQIKEFNNMDDEMVYAYTVIKLPEYR